MDNDFDVIVAGAGPAGCLAARDLARSGFRVGLFDRSPRERLGKPIVVEVESAIFASVGLTPPTDEEIPYHPKRIRVFSARGREAYSLGAVPAVALRLDRLVRRLLREAEREGAVFYGGYRAESLVGSADHIRGAVFRHEAGRAEIRARLVMDATGFDSALVMHLDEDLGFGFVARKRDEVLAANALYGIDQEEAARAIRAGRHGDEELHIRLGMLGSYSTEFSHLSLRKGRAYILIGHKAEYPAPPLNELIRDFGKQQGYYRRRLYGGQGSIRIATILDRLVCNGFMALGEAACMVMPINGSGVASALLSGNMAARAAADALNSASVDTEALWPYAVRYQRKRGAALAAYSALRFMTEGMNTGQVAAMLESGLSTAEDHVNATEPKAFSMSATSIPGRLLALIRNPGLCAPLLRNMPRALTLYRHHLAYPERFDPGTFEAWRRRSRRIFPRLSTFTGVV